MNRSEQEEPPDMVPSPEPYFPPHGEWTVERRWFFQFFVGILLCVNNGACFCFALFSDYFRVPPFSFTQSEISTIATVGVLLSYFSFPTGFLYDRKGPTPTLMVGTALNACGWFGLAYLFRGPSTEEDSNGYSRPIGAVIFFYGISQLSASFFETSAMLTNLKAFSCYPGRVVMIQKTFMGLGTSLVAQVYFLFFQTSPSMTPFFMFLGLYSCTVGVLSYFFMVLPSSRSLCLGLNVMDKETIRLYGGGEPAMFRRPFRVGSIILFLNVGAVLSISFVENCFHVGSFLQVFFGILTIGLAFSFLAMFFVTPSYKCNINGYRSEEESTIASPLTQEGRSYGNEREYTGNRRSDMMTEIINETGENEGATAEVPTEVVVSTNKRHHHKVLMNIGFNHFLLTNEDEPINLNTNPLWENMQKRDIWLLWFICFATWSAMTLIASNCSQIYQSVSNGAFSSMINAVYVSIFGVASALGRIAIGFLHPLLQRERVAITALSCLAPVLNVIGLPLFLVVPTSLLFVPFLFVGLATGSSWGSTILIVTTLFAPKNCGKHYSLLYTAGMLSPVVFNIALFGPVYDYYSRKQGHGGDHLCAGVVCIAIPIISCFLVNAMAFPASVYLTRRTIRQNGV